MKTPTSSIKPTIGVAILTLNAKHHLFSCLTPIINSSLNPKILIVDSSSRDGTVEEAKKFGVETVTISQRDFNHGLTREMARQRLNCDIVVMVTPDAYMKDRFVLEKLIKPIIEGHSVVAYARQIPHMGADFFESFPRYFNYPSESHQRTIKDIEKYGVYTFFCSDSCAAYSNKALDEIGGFHEVLLGEDTVAVAHLLRKGYQISYVSDALVYHSHRYSLVDEFKRHFDTGLARKSYGDLLECHCKDSQRGTSYIKELFSQLIKKNPKYLPYACAHIFIKALGYYLGKNSVCAPRWFKKTFSSQKYYWKNDKRENSLNLKSNHVKNSHDF